MSEQEKEKAKHPPTVMTVEQITQMMPELKNQLDQLQQSHLDLSGKLERFEKALHENDGLKHLIDEKMNRIFELFEQEWIRREAFFPEIFLKLAEKTNNEITGKQ